ncbi:unnamed protein product, partial [Oppiella nova]
MQKLKNQTFIEIPKELGRNTTFTITSDDIRLLNITVTSPNGTVYSMTSDIVVYKPTEMKAQFNIRLATEGKWKVSFEKRQHETVIAYLSVTSESRVDEPIKVRAWMDTPFAGTGKPPTAVINAEVTKRYNYIICADVIAMVDRPKGQPIFIQLYDNGVVIAIHSDVKESDQLITNLEELLRKSSAFLYKATEGRARFVEFEVILPETWSKKDGYESIAGSHFLSSHIRIAPTDKVKSDEPYTYQPRGCGQPGEYIQLTDGFVNQLNGKTRDDFEYPEKHLIHEWAHYRYGVFDEYGIEGDSKYPSFYLENGTIYPTTCIKGIKGRQEDMDGNPCKIYSGGQVDSNCRFIPDKSDNSAVASIMFMPHIQSIEKFCLNNTNDTKLLHNNYAPNKHNIQCNYRSTAEVIEEHRDFKNQNPDTLSDGYSEPVIRLIRIDEDQSSRFVLVLDVSGSMRDFGRSALLHRAATRFVNDLIPDGMELGIIQFSTNATVLHPMITINETTRQSLAATIPKIPEGWTAIGKGLQLALEMLSEDEGGTRGATIILITDGEENQKEPTIEEIIPEVYKADIKVDSIAISTEADARLENISSNSGGKCFYMRDNDNATNTAMETAFMGFVSQQASEVGVWEVIIDKNYSYNRDIVVALTVTSDPKNPNNQPIRVNSYFGELEVRYPATALIYAEVMKGPNGIIGAKVLAIVERPDAEDVEVDLYDDGIGADISANDGIYTTAFTQFTQNG